MFIRETKNIYFFIRSVLSLVFIDYLIKSTIKQEHIFLWFFGILVNNTFCSEKLKFNVVVNIIDKFMNCHFILCLHSFPFTLQMFHFDIFNHFCFLWLRFIFSIIKTGYFFEIHNFEVNKYLEQQL